jgi:hypothetical protein
MMIRGRKQRQIERADERDFAFDNKRSGYLRDIILRQQSANIRRRDVCWTVCVLKWPFSRAKYDHSMATAMMMIVE